MFSLVPCCSSTFGGRVIQRCPLLVLLCKTLVSPQFPRPPHATPTSAGRHSCSERHFFKVAIATSQGSRKEGNRREAGMPLQGLPSKLVKQALQVLREARTLPTKAPLSSGEEGKCTK